MKISTRKFCLASADTFYRLPKVLYERMMSRRDDTRLPQFAAQAVRCADVSVEVQNQRAIRAISITPYIMVFDKHGALDRDALLRYWVDRYEAMGSDSSNHGSEANPAAAARAAAMTWEPSRAITTLLYEAALGIVKTPSLR